MLKINTEEKIVKINGFALSSPYGDGKVFGQPMGVKSLGFIEVISESGKIGFGETYCGIYSPSLISPIVEFLSPHILGKKLSNLDFIESLNKIPFIGNSGIINSIIVGVELAILDLIGKIENKPIYKLFSEENNLKKVNCYFSGGSVVFSPEEIKNDLIKSKEEGFNNYKMRIGLQDWNIDLERLLIAKQNIDQGGLMVDAIMGTLKNKWDLETALLKAKDLEKFNLKWLEEPLCPTEISNYGILKNKTKIPIAMGEAYSGDLFFKLIKSQNIADIIQVDATHSMGFRNLLEFSNKTVSNKATHVWGSSLSFIANGTLAALSKNISIHEYPSVDFEISKEIVQEKLKFKNGEFVLSDYPGFGIDINQKIKDKYKFVKNSGYSI
jgi:L-alanine-DL-glutamate epimerase-like enolase superfamily enzyme